MQNPFPIEFTAHEGPFGSFAFWRRRPAPGLQAYITDLQGYEEKGGTPVVRDELPSGLLHLIVVLDRSFTLERGSGVTEPLELDRTFIAGLHRGPSTVGSGGEALCMEVGLTPLGARRLLREDLGLVGDRVAFLHALDPRFADMLEGRLREANSWQHRFELFEAMLADRILGTDSGDARVVHAWSMIERSGGRIEVGALAGHLDISRKHLHQLFTRETGVSPKAYARLVRFERAIECLQASVAGRRSDPLAEVAFACGYADQAHMAREFTGFAGAPPSILLARMMGTGLGIAAGQESPVG